MYIFNINIFQIIAKTQYSFIFFSLQNHYSSNASIGKFELPKLKLLSETFSLKLYKIEPILHTILDVPLLLLKKLRSNFYIL